MSEMLKMDPNLMSASTMQTALQQGRSHSAAYHLKIGAGLTPALARNRQQVTARRKRFEIQSHDSDTQALHRCAICGATELSDPNLEFRVASNGEEYCLPHLAQAKVTPA